MIPNTLASIGPYADLWSLLKAMDHALERALDRSTAESLAELDRDQLLALVRFLQGSLTLNPDEDLTPLSSLHRAEAPEANYTVDFDLRQYLRTLSSFHDWRSASKIGYEKKAQDLLDALTGFVQAPSESLFPKNAPKEEFAILRSLLASLMREAEPAIRR